MRLGGQRDDDFVDRMLAQDGGQIGNATQHGATGYLVGHPGAPLVDDPEQLDRARGSAGQSLDEHAPGIARAHCNNGAAQPALATPARHQQAKHATGQDTAGKVEGEPDADPQAREFDRGLGEKTQTQQGAGHEGNGNQQFVELTAQAGQIVEPVKPRHVQCIGHQKDRQTDDDDVPPGHKNVIMTHVIGEQRRARHHGQIKSAQRAQQDTGRDR